MLAAAGVEDPRTPEEPEPIVETVAEVLDLAREILGPVEDPVTPPTSPGRAPLAKRGTDKATFFKGDWREAWPRDFRVYEGGAG